MTSATYFGEISELVSRAILYSDDEDEDENATKTERHPTHDTLRYQIHFKLTRCGDDTEKIARCKTCCVIVTKRMQKSQPETLVGFSGDLVKVHVLAGTGSEPTLLIEVNGAHPELQGYKSSYIVEQLFTSLQIDLNLDSSNPIYILSSQYSKNERIEYLSTRPVSDKISNHMTFNGDRLSPPTLIENAIEAGLFEILTLKSWPAFVICLPDPRYTTSFHKINDWPQLPESIIDERFRDLKDSIELSSYQFT